MHMVPYDKSVGGSSLAVSYLLSQEIGSNYQHRVTDVIPCHYCRKVYRVPVLEVFPRRHNDMNFCSP